MKKLLTITLILILLLCTVTYGRKTTGLYEERVGNFTGPITGTEQDDNIKASLDLAHTDLDAMITYDTDVLALLGQSTGGVFYVDSSASGTTGVTWATAVNDLEEAMALCTNDAGDIIILAPGHAETIGGAAAIDLDISGITIIGLGTGELRPTFTYDTTTDSIAIGADDVRIKNCRFIATVTAVANAIIIEATMENTIIEDCIFENETAGTDEFVDTILISGTGSDGTIIRNNIFMSDTSENAGPKASINFVDCDLLEVYGNKFFGDAGDAHVFNETTASNFVSIYGNTFHQGAIGDAKLDTTPAISLVATTTGLIYDNTIAVNTANESLAIVAADCHVFGNRYSEIQGSSLEVGKTYVMSSATVVSGATDNIFTVAGGRIEIISMFGECTTVIGTVGATDIYVDATAGSDYDADFSTAVDIDALGAGDTITFSNAISEGVLTFVANQGAGQPLSWYCPAGILIVDPTTTSTGAITWWMTFRPLEEGVTVVVGP